MDENVNRRRFLTGAATTAAALAGCTSTKNSRNQYSGMEFRGLAERIQDDLWSRGYEAPDGSVLADALPSFGDTDLISVDVGLDSVVDIARTRGKNDDVERWQDLYLLAGTNNLDTLYDDTSEQLHEISSIVDENVVSFLDNRDIPEDHERMTISADLVGSRDTRLGVYERIFNPGDSVSSNNGLEDLEQEWLTTGPNRLPRGLQNSPMEYEELAYLPLNTERTLELGGDKYTVQPHRFDHGNVLEADKNDSSTEYMMRLEWGPEIHASDDFEVELESEDPIYMENGVEVRFPGESVDYFPTQ